MPPTRTKLSGLSGPKATAAYKVLQTLKTVLVTYPDDDEPEANQEEDPQKVAEAEARVREMNGLLSRLETIFATASSKSVSFSKITDEILEDTLNIKPCIPDEYLSMKPQEELVTLATQRNEMGENTLWSLDNYVQQLNFLERTVPRNCEAAPRLWIDTVFFRASSLIPSSDALVLHLEAGGPSLRRSRSSITASGVIDYIAIAVPKSKLTTVLSKPQIGSLHGLTGLFAAEAKQDDGPLAAHLPQALAEQYACAIQLKQKILRGVLTNGEDWIFTVVTCKDSDTGGATYRRSLKLSINFHAAITGGLRTVYRDTIDLIPAILADFIIHSFEDIQPDEYFVS